MRNLSDIVVRPELQGAIRMHTSSERELLKAEIVRDGMFTDPVLWARLAGGEEVFVDGHTRLSIYDEIVAESPECGIEPPRLAEVESLRDATIEQAVAWIRKHQAGRRNDESLSGLYEVGKKFIDGNSTSVELASEFGLSPSQVRHAGTLAKKIDEAESIEPGTREAVLGSDLSKSFIRDSEPGEIVASAQSGARKPKGELEMFRPITSGLAKIAAQSKAISRAVNELQNERTADGNSEKCIAHIERMNSLLDEFRRDVEGWIESVV